ncbi:GNAT family N-acetyltransferase [Curtobacterium sp. MCSS17_005]|uniref:GNAT family N-acetyltransferase n=1 Tax=Curtobacterium sp. MCSS17_005 TaxID=2175641 RepID=UPI0021ABA76C|nr:GNAT family N-acetyltransferase [Curtobacterium sp. MCSS17_005]WIB32620.1 GNAT family N-acetyltransferase [Curtobacterium sp. MCSS17_005]
MLRAFLLDADLTVAGLDASTVRLWVERDDDGRVVGSTGYETSTDGAHVLIRSVAVAPDRRGTGVGSRLARFVIDRASEAGAERAWLFSRRSGPFWQSLGFGPADRLALAVALPDTRQVRLFRQTGQLDHEVAWSRRLPVR